MKKEEKLELLLNYLLKHNEHWISGKHLNEYIQISSRQLRNYIYEWNLRYPGLILSSEHGYFVEPTAYKAYLHQKEEPFSVEKRQDHILELLCDTKSGIDIFDLESTFHISIPSLEADITYLKLYVSTFALSIQRKQHMLYLIGEESDTRKLLCQLYEKRLYAHFFLEHDNYQLTCKNVAKCLEEHHIIIDESTISYLSIYLSIAIQRIQKGFYLSTTVNTTTYEAIAHHIFTSVYHLQPQSTEVAYFSNMIDHATTSLSFDDSSFQDAWVQFQTELQFDGPTLYDSLFLWYQKTKRDQTFFSHFQATVYPLSFTYPLADFLAKRFLSYLDVNSTQKAIYELTKLFASKIASILPKEPLDVVLVYQSLYGEEQQLVDLLIKSFTPDVRMIKRIPWYAYDHSLDTSDLIICNTNLMFYRTYVHMHPVCNEKDIYKLRYVIAHQLHKKRRSHMVRWLTSYTTMNTTNILPSTEHYVLMFDQGFPLFYAPQATHTSLRIYQEHQHLVFLLDIQKDQIQTWMQIYDDLIAIISDKTYQKQLLFASDTTSFLQLMTQALHHYHQKLEKAII